MKIKPHTLSAISGVGTLSFVLVIGFLHYAQPSYDPSSQFMSELAFGRFGGLLLLAFVGLSASTAATAINVYTHNSSLLLPLMLGLTAISFFAAGIVTLDTSSQTHIFFVAVAFVSCGASMYLLPRTVEAFYSLPYRLTSWGSCLTMCGAIGLGGNLLLPAIAQRIAALAMLFWLSVVAWRLAR